MAHDAPLSVGILQARILEWVAMTLLQGIFSAQGLNQVSHNAGGFFTAWATGCILGV